MIPVAEPCVTEQDIELVSESLRSVWRSTAGKLLEQFEEVASAVRRGLA